MFRQRPSESCSASVRFWNSQPLAGCKEKAHIQIWPGIGQASLVPLGVIPGLCPWGGHSTFAQIGLFTWVVWALGHSVRALGRSMPAGTLVRAQQAGLGQGVGQLAPSPLAKSTWILEMSGRGERRLRGAESPGARKLEWDLASHKGYPLLLDTYRPGLQSPSSLQYFGLHFLTVPHPRCPGL